MGDLKLTSPGDGIKAGFSDGGEMPRKYGYYHGNISPPLTIDGIPDGTKSLTLIMDDPDAMKVPDDMFPDGKNPYKDPFVHWVLYNISPFLALRFEDTGSIKNRRITIPKSETTSMAPLTIHNWEQAQGNPDAVKKNKEVLTQYMIAQYRSNFGMLGVNGYGEFAYGGPAPPDKKHTYYFTLYATDLGGHLAYAHDPAKRATADTLNPTKKKLFPSITKDDIIKKMKESTEKGKTHILDKATLTGTYAP